MDKPKKNYVWNWKEVINQYGSIINAYLNVDKLALIKNEKGYARVTITKNREPDQYWNTHSVIENTWKPKETTQVARDMFNNRPNITDIPF